jgi:hypothetical protein
MIAFFLLTIAFVLFVPKKVRRPKLTLYHNEKEMK